MKFLTLTVGRFVTFTGWPEVSLRQIFRYTSTTATTAPGAYMVRHQPDNSQNEERY